MRTYEQCIPCFERQAAEACTLCGMDQKETAGVLAAVQARIESFPRSHSPIEMAVEIHTLVHAAAGIDDPYRAIKEQSNQACRESMSVFSKLMASERDPFETAVKLAIAGNIIDFGAYRPVKLCSRDILRSVRITVTEPLCGESPAALASLIDRAENILYIGDNAGECFLDSFLLDQIPAARCTYAVRGGPVLNDATIEDARAAGIDARCRIVDTGDNAPGVLIERCSPAFQRGFDAADLVIAKGQGNYESLGETQGKTCVFLTKVKCPVIAEDVGYPVGSNVIRIINTELQVVQTRRLDRDSSRREVCHA